MTPQEARAAWAQHRPAMEARGVYLSDVQSYLPEEFKQDFGLAMDALPALATTASAGVPAMLTTLIDPAVFKVLFAPNKAAIILGEVRKGTWLDETAVFPLVEHVGEVASYGDYAETGHTGANTNWPQRQSYLYQTIKEYGDRELERAGLARINWVSEIDQAAATVLGKFQNLSYFFGVKGLQNYGLLNDPNLSASLTPGTKAAGNGNVWITSAGAMNATANEVYADIQSLFFQLVNQTGGIAQKDAKLCLAMSPGSQVALGIKNTFGLSATDMMKNEFPNLRVETAVQYGALTATNPQGVAAGNYLQLIADNLEGQQTGYCAFNEKMRSHPLFRALSSFKQKLTGGTWGTVIRQPAAIASMVGI